MSWYDAAGNLISGRPPGSSNKTQRVQPRMRFGLWRVIRRTANSVTRQPRFLCRCKCGKRRIVFGDHLVKGRSKSCGCSPATGSAHVQWSGYGDISGDYWHQIRRCASRAKGRSYNIEFCLTIKYAWRLFLRQKRRCNLTGVPLQILAVGRTASLDRIDSKRGYVPGNVQWVHKDVNMMKGKFLQTRFIEVCRQVTKHATKAKRRSTS